MNSNIYDNTLKYIKHNYIFLLIIIGVVVFANINTGYSIYRPGGIININERIIINGEHVNKDGNISMSYASMMEGKLPFVILARIIPTWTLVRNTDMTYNESETIRDMMQRNRLYYEESINHAKYLAYLRSGTPFTIISQNNYVTHVTEKSTTDLQIGDLIIEYNGRQFLSVALFREYINTKSPDDEILIVYSRNDERRETVAIVYEENGLNFIGIRATTIFEFETDKKVTIDVRQSESGPSGGLMLTLAIYNALVASDITKGRNVSGTGTIDIDGRVGIIGGIPYKISGAVRSGVDIFLVPEENYDEAITYKNERRYDIIIIGVTDFDHALTALKNLEG